MSDIKLSRQQTKDVVLDFIASANAKDFKWLVLSAFERRDFRDFDTMEVLPKLRKQLMGDHCLESQYVDRIWRGK